jgi:PRTRC genetic system protein C
MTARTIKFGDIVLPDPDPSMHLDDVRKLYATQYPALNNAVITYPEGKEKEGSYEFSEKSGQTAEFKPSVGRKG